MWDTIDQMARAIGAVLENKSPSCFVETEQGIRCRWELEVMQNAAKAAREKYRQGLKDGGLVVVPRKPTEEMLDFGGKDGPYFDNPDQWHELPFNQVDFRRELYQAMIDIAVDQFVDNVLDKPHD